MTGPSSTRRPAVVLLAALALLTTSCGVPTDSTPRALSTAEIRIPSPAPSALQDPAGDRQVDLWFVRDGQVVPTTRRVEGPTPIPELLRMLFRGASQEEQTDGLISVIPATLTLEEVRVQGDTAVLTVDGPDSEVQRTQPLAWAQIVATLTPDHVDGVRFRLDGRDLDVPRGDGSLSDGPVSRDDYAELLAAPPAAADAADPAAEQAAAEQAADPADPAGSEPAPPAPAPASSAPAA